MRSLIKKMTAFQKAEVLEVSATTETSCSRWFTRSQRISACRTVSRDRRCGQYVDTGPMLSIAAAGQPCNSAGTISKRGFGRSGRLASTIPAVRIGLGVHAS